jgi:hypothetical protein
MAGLDILQGVTGGFMEAFFVSGRVADLILATLAAEAGLLAWLGARGIGPGLRAVLPFLLAGAAFALALRAALTGAGWPLVAAPLTAAFAAHLWDLAARWRR